DGQGPGFAGVVWLGAVRFGPGLWGPVGSVLATPLPTCLAVLGKYIPGLEPLAILIGEAPPTRPVPMNYYQRLVAKDEDAASRIARAYLEAHSREERLDDFLLPALAWANRDHRGSVRTRADRTLLMREQHR